MILNVLLQREPLRFDLDINDVPPDMVAVMQQVKQVHALHPRYAKHIVFLSFGDVLRRPVIHSDFLERNKTFEENCIAVFRSCYI